LQTIKCIYVVDLFSSQDNITRHTCLL